MADLLDPFLQHVPEFISPVEHQQFPDTSCNLLPHRHKKMIKNEVLNVKDKESSWEKCKNGQWNQLGCAVPTLTALKCPHSVLHGTRSLQVQAKLCQVPAVRKSFKV